MKIIEKCKDFHHYNLATPIQNIIIDMPFGKHTQKLKRYYLKKRLHHCGNDATFGQNVRLFSIQNISIGHRSSIGKHTEIYASDKAIVQIGNDCLIAPHVTIMNSNHAYTNRNDLIRNQGYTTTDIIIGDDCWIGTRVIILEGVTIGNGCVIGAGAIVTKNIESYSIAAGIPAKVIKKR